MEDTATPPLSPPRARLAEAVASLGAAAYRNRGDRFLARIGTDAISTGGIGSGGQPISFNNLRRMPRWWSMPDESRDEIATIACLLNYRVKIDQELDGNRLRALVSTTGEPLFDTACSCTRSLAPVAASVNRPLPIGKDVLTEGWQILHYALPSGFAETIPNARGDIEALELADQAVALWKEHNAPLMAQEPSLAKAEGEQP